MYVVMEYASGGDLCTYMNKQHPSRLTEESIRFYSAQVLLALQYLHTLCVLYRDLKPENLLLDNQGYVKLCDMGLAKIISRRTYSFCGTIDYMAPEMIMCRGYSFSVDMWTLGVLIYELTTGSTPFDVYVQAEEFVNSVKMAEYNIPFFVKSKLRSLITSLLQPDITKRLGCKKQGLREIADHPFYDGINFESLLRREIAPPYTPKVSSFLSVVRKNKYEEDATLPMVNLDESKIEIESDGSASDSTQESVFDRITLFFQNW